MRSKQYHISKKTLGFTLVEMAVVTLLLGIMMTLGLKLATSQMDNASYGVTLKKQEALKDALIAFLGKNRYLPCPDTRPAGSTTTGKIDFSVGTSVPDGKSDPIPGGTGYVCAFETGLIPYATLILSPDMARDGWDNYFTYQVWNGTPGDLTDPGKFTDTPRLAVSPFTPYGYPLTQVTPGGTTTSSNVSVIIVSHGKNGLGAFNLKGGQNMPLPDATNNANERANAYDPASTTKHSPTAPTPYVRQEINDTFDDVVFTITGDELITGLRKNNSVPNMSAQALDQLAMARDAIFGYQITNPSWNPHCNFPSAGTFLTLTATTDPWGQTLRYSQGPGFGFTVASNGPDRTQSTADDLSVSLTDTVVRGRAANIGINCY
jgi:type II secretory pathway pseudopilin PulG